MSLARTYVHPRLLLSLAAIVSLLGASAASAQGLGAITAAPGSTGAAQVGSIQPFSPQPMVPAPAPAATPVLPGAAAPSTAGLDPAMPGASATPALTPAAPKPKPKAPPPPPRETALPTTTTPTFTAETVFTTARAAERYAQIADAGGWDAMPAGLRPGAKGPNVSALRHRLAIEGDLDPSQEGDAPFNEVWDGQLTAAVKHFQERMGLKPTGIVAGATLKAMNVPASVRFRQLASSAQRIAGSNFAFGERYVVVNIPSASVEAVEKGRIVHRYVAVVGDAEHRSPETIARVQAVNLNPTWTVPTSIIKNEIIPHMRKDPTYLSRAKIRILDNKGAEIDPRNVDWNSEKAVNYTLRQDSGAGNSLGAIRINMPNKDAVYMHDTPSKRFFANDYRFLSHGCVRVEGVYDLAAWLLEGTMNTDAGVWDKAALLQGVAAKDRLDIKLAKSVPVAWVYLTGYADADGVVHFRDDVYNVDNVGAEMATQPQVRADR
jgi:murein L,D-transpeptidase YcbB/YkuD